MAFDGSIRIDTAIDGKGFSAGLGKLGNIAKGAFSGITAAIGTAAAALAGGAAAAVNLGMEYEAQMSRVKAIAGATADEFTRLNEQAKQLGADTSFSASQAADGMENLASAGFSVNEIVAAMPGMLDLAASSGEDLATSSDIAASTLRGFGLAAEDAAHVADVLAKNAAQTNAAVADTGYAMKYVAPVAKTAGWALEATAAAIGELANAGIKGDQAGTTLRGALTSLMNPSKKAQDTMDALGFSAYDSAGKMKSLSQIINELNSSTQGLTDKQKNAAIATIFGTEALSGMQVLLGTGGGKLDEMTASLVKSDGAAKAMAATMNDNLKGAIDGLTGSAETLGIELYQSVDNPLKDVVKTAAGWVNQLTDAFKSGGTEGLVTAVGTVLSDAITQGAQQAPGIVNMAINLIQSLVTGLQTNSAQIAQAGVEIVTTLAFGILSIASQLGAVAIDLLNALIKGITPQLPKIAVQAVAIVGTLITGILGALPAILTAAVQIVLGLVQGLVQALPTLIPTAVECILTIVQTLVDNLPMLIDAAIQLVLGLVNGIIAAIPKILEAAPKIVIALVNGIVQAIPKLLDAALQIILALIKFLPEYIPMLIDASFQIITAIVSGLISAVGEIWKFVPKLFSELWDALKSIDWGKLGKNIIDGVAKGITGAASKIAEAAKKAAQNALDAMKKLLGIHSPSKVFEKEVGAMLPPGVGIGVERAMPRALRGMKAQMGGMVDKMRDAVVAEQGRLGATFAANANYQLAMAGGPEGGIDYDAFWASAPDMRHGHDIIMDGRKVAKAVEPEISGIQADKIRDKGR